jgi:hypothetical protein
VVWVRLERVSELSLAMAGETEGMFKRTLRTAARTCLLMVELAQKLSSSWNAVFGELSFTKLGSQGIQKRRSSTSNT